MEQQNAYRVLGLRKGASEEEVKSAFVELVRKYDQETHTDKFIAVTKAHEILRDPAKRAREDIQTFNYVQGGFKFTADEQTREPDALLNQALQDSESNYSQHPENTESQAAYIKTLMMRSFKKATKHQWAEAIEDWLRILIIVRVHLQGLLP